MARTKAEKEKAIFDEAVSEFDSIVSAQRDEREQCMQDRRFYSIAGAQWEGKLGEQFENKPKFEVNKVHLSVIRIINEYRNNRVTVNFISKDGEDRDAEADLLDGLYRAAEQESNAEEAYDNAFEESVGGGVGAWRLRAEYEDEDDDEDERQKICIEPIYDADSTVFFDLGAKRQDKADARTCYVLTGMSLEEYEETYGDDVSSWDKSINNQEFDWVDDDTVYVAEYYRVEKKRETIYIYQTIDGEEERFSDADFENDAELEIRLQAIGTKKVREKKIFRRKVHKYILSGRGILEDCGYIAGKNIPIVPEYGKRWVVDNIERYMGHVRLSKDAQRLFNMQLSKLGEIAALSTIEKPILTNEQVEGNQQYWQNDNIENYAYLPINQLTDDNGNIVANAPVAYTRAPNIPPAMAALLQLTESNIRDLLGNQEAGEELLSGMSGEAIGRVQDKIDMQAYIYMSNFAKSMKRCGEIFLSMAKELFIEPGRKMRIVDGDGKTSTIELMKAKMKDGELIYENDLSRAKLNVVASVGASSSSKRQSTIRSITGMMQMTADPETMSVLSSLAMMNMEGEGVEDARMFFRKRLVKMGVIEPTEQEIQELTEAAQNTPPDPQTQYLQAAARAEDSKAMNAQADIALKMAKTQGEIAEVEKTQAEVVEILSSIDRAEIQQYLETASAVKETETAQPLQVSEIENGVQNGT